MSRLYLPNEHNVNSVEFILEKADSLGESILVGKIVYPGGLSVVVKQSVP